MLVYERDKEGGEDLGYFSAGHGAGETLGRVSYRVLYVVVSFSVQRSSSLI